MKLNGDIRKIGMKRDSKFQDISVEIDKVEYLTHKKDGRYFQAFDYEVELETPLIITGDRLAKKNQKPMEEGELEFLVYDIVNGEYVLNENVQLEVITAFDFEENLLILSWGYYGITIPPKEFEALKKEHEKLKGFKSRKDNKRA